MNNNAANALLKTLEEPAPNILIILISDLNLRMPATIKSRCQKVTFSKPDYEVGVSWLQFELPENTIDPRLLLNLAYGAPLKAKELATSDFFVLRQELYKNMDLLARRQLDPLQLAAKLQDQESLIVLNLLLVWLQDLLRFKLTMGNAELVNVDCQNIFATLARTIPYQNVLDYYDHVKKAYSYLARALNLNRQLMLEELFIRWIHYATR
jgi:DNA polymerase-3 subunit delta'